MTDLSRAANAAQSTAALRISRRGRLADPGPFTTALRVVNVLGIGGFVGLLAALQALPTGLGFARGTVSAYCFHPYGELARFALVSLTTGGAAAALLVRRLPGRTGRSAVVLLAVWALGVAIDAFATTDRPHTTVTVHGQVHLVATAVATTCLGVATVLVAINRRGQPRWTVVISAACVLAIVGFLVAPVAVSGLAERFLLGADAVWLVMLPLVSYDVAAPAQTGTIGA